MPTPSFGPRENAAVQRVRKAIEELIHCRPEDWAEILPGIAGAACSLDPGQLSLLADAATQVAAAAHQLATKAEEDEGQTFDPETN